MQISASYIELLTAVAYISMAQDSLGMHMRCYTFSVSPQHVLAYRFVLEPTSRVLGPYEPYEPYGSRSHEPGARALRLKSLRAVGSESDELSVATYCNYNSRGCPLLTKGQPPLLI